MVFRVTNGAKSTYKIHNFSGSEFTVHFKFKQKRKFTFEKKRIPSQQSLSITGNDNEAIYLNANGDHNVPLTPESHYLIYQFKGYPIETFNISNAQYERLLYLQDRDALEQNRDVLQQILDS